jgi:dinuclear metal center YbgI/SA1388 family protein
LLPVGDLVALIESTAHPDLAEEWDLSGMQAAGTRDPLQRVAVSLDPVEPVIEKALAWEADFILTHHPLTLSPRLPAEDEAYTRILRRLLRSGAWLYAAHTSLDANSAGPVSWLAAELGLRGTVPIRPRTGALPAGNAEQAAGLGLIGDLRQPLPAQEFRAALAQALRIPSWTCCGDWPDTVARVAYCPGSGMSLAPEAFDAGADVFISGDLKYHQAQDLEARGLVLDVGHFCLEERMMRRWSQDLSRSLGEAGPEIRFFEGHNPMSIQAG